jgi:ubiquinone/menaquinone biosynthesis C-methylase UbiE
MKFLFTFGISLSAFLSGLSQAEGYLHAWHSRHADASRVFIEARDPDGRSSYERLATLASPGACVLDVACGTGALLARVGATVSSTQLVGVDFCQSELRLARGRLPGVALYAARAQALPLTDAAFDLVVCHMALMLMDNPERALAESRRVLRRGGTFSAITNLPAAPDEIAKTILGALRSRWKAASPSLLPAPALGDARTHDTTTLLPLVSAYFQRVVVEPFAVTQRVSRAELWPYLVNSIYGLDAIPAHEGEEALADLPLPDPVPWTVAMVQVQGRA